jgi:hypothetical protein
MLEIDGNTRCIKLKCAISREGRAKIAFFQYIFQYRGIGALEELKNIRVKFSLCLLCLGADAFPLLDF